MFKSVFVWVWCFPQMLIGFIFKKITKSTWHGDHYRHRLNIGSVSLGEYIFLDPTNWEDEETLNHEKGHCKQSLLLGWLYLFVIGIPSIIWCGCFGWYRKKYNIDYYDFFTEKWADRLAGIERR